VAVVLAAALVLAACAQGRGGGATASPPIESLRALYAYDESKPLDAKQAGSSSEDGVEVRDISYASVKSGRVTAYLVLPVGKGPFPAVVFLPGLSGGRSVQLSEAKDLAGHGAASLLIDSPDVRPGGPQLISCTKRDRAPYIQYVIEVRRGLDLLAVTREVDAARLGVVGFSFGSAIAATLAGVEKRLKAVVVDSGRAYNSRFFRSQCAYRLKKKRLAAYAQNLKFTDGVNYVPYASPAALLFQNGSRDPFTPRAEALALQKAGSSPKTVKWYSASHDLNDAAFADRTAWLATQLGFQP
jgi:dienelactone hydrolase